VIGEVWPWLTLALLGAYHGIDPSMGWLFAVALGLQERSRATVVRALVPIAIGHLIAIGVVVALVGWLSAVFALDYLKPAGAALLIAFGLFRLIRPRAHPRWVAMRVTPSELALWSFLMASAHGAGLMLFPVLVGMRGTDHRAMHAGHGATVAAASVVEGIAVVGVHTLAMLVVMGAVAVVVYQWVGLAILRSAWVNLDVIWAAALIGAGILTLLL
jgi:hypothetical protein